MNDSLVRVFKKIEESPAVAQHGQVMTKPHIVDLILDLCGYTSDQPLHKRTLLDPGCGDGEFLVNAATRLFSSCSKPDQLDTLSTCLLGVEKDDILASRAKDRLIALARKNGLTSAAAKKLANQWVLTGDFLAMHFKQHYDYVVGNPPYVRQEAIPKSDLANYREAFSCFYDRADLYIAFLEKELSLLSPTGILGVICPNRFTRNRYGCKLRSLIASNFRLIHAVDLSLASPFTPEVMAYPGIYVIGRGSTNEVNFFHMTDANESECAGLLYVATTGVDSGHEGLRYHKYDQWFANEEPWVTESPKHLDLARRIESTFSTLGSSESGTHVGIGVATGADKVFIVPSDFSEVEKELLLPLAMTGDCITGRLRWGGKCVINPFESEERSSLIDLSKYPLAKAYFKKHELHLRKRNVGKRNPFTWYRTIDRINTVLLRKPKLLIPDIKAEGLITYDSGMYYPHHNLYYIVSSYWNLHALRTILRSSIAQFFVWIYGVRMRNDYLRFQAQYLRRIPVPTPLFLSDSEMQNLIDLDVVNDIEVIDNAVSKIYGLSTADMKLVRGAIARNISPELDEPSQFGGLNQPRKKDVYRKSRVDC